MIKSIKKYEIEVLYENANSFYLEMIRNKNRTKNFLFLLLIKDKNFHCDKNSVTQNAIESLFESVFKMARDFMMKPNKNLVKNDTLYFEVFKLEIRRILPAQKLKNRLLNKIN